MNKPKFCEGELVDFLGTDMVEAEREVEIIESSYCYAGEQVFDDQNRPRIIKEDGWWYKHRSADLFSPEEQYRKRPDKRVPFSSLFRREIRV